MALAHADGIAACAGVEDAILAVAAGGGEEGAGGVEGEALDGIVVAAEDALGGLGGGEVPEFDDVIACGGGKDVVGGGVEEDVADAAGGDVDAGDGVKVLGLPALGAPAFEDRGLDLRR